METKASIDLPGFNIGEIHVGFRLEENSKLFGFKNMITPFCICLGIILLGNLYSIELLNANKLKEFMREQIKMAGKDPDDYVKD